MVRHLRRVLRERQPEPLVHGDDRDGPVAVLGGIDVREGVAVEKAPGGATLMWVKLSASASDETKRSEPSAFMMSKFLSSSPGIML